MYVFIYSLPKNLHLKAVKNSQTQVLFLGAIKSMSFKNIFNNLFLSAHFKVQKTNHMFTNSDFFVSIKAGFNCLNIFWDFISLKRNYFQYYIK